MICNKIDGVLFGTTEEGCLCLVLDAAAMVGPVEGNEMPFFGAVKHDELGEPF